MKMRLRKSTKVRTKTNGNNKNGNGNNGNGRYYPGKIIDGAGRLATSNGNSYWIRFSYKMNGKEILKSRVVPESVLKEYGRAAIPLSEGLPIKVIVSEGKLEKVCDSQDKVIF
jgi:hypothetical protein